MIKKLHELALSRDVELRERLFRVIILAGAAMALLGVIENALVADLEKVLLPAMIQLIIVAAALFLTFKYRKMDFASILVGFVICVKVFPDMFFLSGGIEGGATVWFVLSMFYVFIMFSGKRLWFFLTLSVVINGATYIIAYRNPELVTPLETRRDIYLDSFFAVIGVGILVGAILKFQMKLYEVERGVALEQKEELEKISESKNKFFANMSHEICTPINTIIGLNEMILRDCPDEQTKEYAQNVRSASEMLLNLVNDILDFSQMESKQMKIVASEYETRELFEDLIDMVEVSAQEKELDFMVDIDEKLPRILYGDERRIKQIILNILTNAVKYTKKGSVALAVHGESTDVGTVALKISVADTGIGIRKEDLEHLYDAFGRVEEWRNTNIEGTGLGLAITKQLLNLMGGEITVDSIYTKGSIFTVTIPQKVIDAAPIGSFWMHRPRNKEEVYRPSFEAPEARVLVVEDNDMNAMVVARLLRETKMQIDIASDGKQCLERTKQKYYHLILMDYLMPGMDGVTTLKELRCQENGLCRESAVIALTANTLISAKQLCREHGFDGFLEKPILPQKLEGEILKFLPYDIVEYRLNPDGERDNQIQQTVGRKKKKIYVASDCVCDLPEELLEKYNIALMYLYIKTDKGRFADTREIDSDNLSQYLVNGECSIHSDGVSVEEYEAFFAKLLTQAENVIHISMASNAGKSYCVAVSAAKGFDHVQVIDSGHISGGEGLLALYAAKLAQDGKSVAEICAEVERMKGKIVSKFLIPNCKNFYAGGYTNAITEKVCDRLNLHPSLTMRQSRLVIAGVCAGRLENAWKRYIRLHLRHKRKICNNIVIITYVGCSVRQQELIREEVLKCVPFEKVIMQKASLSNACNAGLETIGIAYCTKF